MRPFSNQTWRTVVRSTGCVVVLLLAAAACSAGPQHVRKGVQASDAPSTVTATTPPTPAPTCQTDDDCPDTYQCLCAAMGEAGVDGRGGCVYACYAPGSVPLAQP